MRISSLIGRDAEGLGSSPSWQGGTRSPGTVQVVRWTKRLRKVSLEGEDYAKADAPMKMSNALKCGRESRMLVELCAAKSKIASKNGIVTGSCQGF